MKRHFTIVVSAAALAGLAITVTPLRTPVKQQREPLGSIVEPRPHSPELHDSVEAELANDQVHSYSVALKAGQYLHLIVDQQGVDVVVTLVDPKGKEAAEVDNLDGSWGPENLHLIAEQTGRYLLQLRPWQRSGPGRYRATVASVRTPTGLDRQRVEAAETFRRAVAWEKQGTTESLRAAVKIYETAMARWHAVGDVLQEAISALRLGRTYFQLGEIATALVHLERSLALLESSEYRGQEAGALTSVARAYRLAGQQDKALAANSRALEIYRSLKSIRGQALCLNNLAVVYDNQGKIEKALELYEQALEMWKQLDEPVEQGSTLHNIGTLYALLGRDTESLDFLRRSLELRRLAGDRRGEAATLTAIGWGHYLLDEPEKAVRHFQEALRLRRAVGDRRGEAATLDRLATTLIKLGRRQQALAAYKQAETILRKSGDKFGLASTFANLGFLYEGWGLPHRSLQYFQEALPMLHEVGDRNAEAAALTGCARAQRVLGELAAARVALERALELLESQGRTSDRLGLRSSFLASRYDSYELYIDLLMELHQRDPENSWDAAALQASERARAQGLLALLRDSRAEIGKKVEPGLLERRRELEEKISSKENERAALTRAAVLGDRRAVLDRELRALLLELERLRAKIRRHSPGYASLTDPKPLTIEQVQREMLDEETALLFFSLGEERSFEWLLTSESLITRVLPPRREIEEVARKAHSLLAASHQSEARSQARTATVALAEMLLGPVADFLDSRRLLIVADGALHYVPFGALPSQGTSESEDRPLLADHEIIYVPSLAVLHALRREVSERRPAPKVLAVFADPVFSSRDPRVRGRSGRKTQQVDAGHRRGGWRGFPPLPHSQDEAKAILDLVPPEARLAALGFAASRKTILSGRLRQYRILHFATHALLDTHNPELSGIVVSLVDEEGRPQDGLLRAHEIYNLELPAELVVLSACKTALGKEVRGEGLVGLASGLMYAGAPRVVVSLWNVSDRATAELMKRFYRGMLQQGLAPPAALRQAQLSMAQEPHWRAPSFWAGFVLLGEPQGIANAVSGLRPSHFSRVPGSTRTATLIPTSRTLERSHYDLRAGSADGTAYRVQLHRLRWQADTAAVRPREPGRRRSIR